MKRETGFFKSKSSDGGCFFAILALIFIAVTLYNLPELSEALFTK